MGETLSRYKKIAVTVPNGRTITGYVPGLAGGQLLEHRLRDHLGRMVHGVTEANLGWGRADVLTPKTVFEVESMGKWRHAIRQALQYGAQTGCQPAIALFGEIHCDDLLALYLKLRDSPPLRLELWWWNHSWWSKIGNRRECRNMPAPDVEGLMADEARVRPA